MVIVRDSRPSGVSRGQGTALCSWVRHFALTVPLCTKAMYKILIKLIWVLVTLC